MKFNSQTIDAILFILATVVLGLGIQTNRFKHIPKTDNTEKTQHEIRQTTIQ